MVFEVLLGLVVITIFFPWDNKSESTFHFAKNAQDKKLTLTSLRHGHRRSQTLCIEYLKRDSAHKLNGLITNGIFPLYLFPTVHGKLFDAATT